MLLSSSLGVQARCLSLLKALALPPATSASVTTSVSNRAADALCYLCRFCVPHLDRLHPMRGSGVGLGASQINSSSSEDTLSQISPLVTTIWELADGPLFALLKTARSSMRSRRGGAFSRQPLQTVPPAAESLDRPLPMRPLLLLKAKLLGRREKLFCLLF